MRGRSASNAASSVLWKKPSKRPASSSGVSGTPHRARPPVLTGYPCSIDHDPAGWEVDLANGLFDGRDQHLATVVGSNDVDIVAAGWHDLDHGADHTAVVGHDPQADDVVDVKPALGKRLGILGTDKQVGVSQRFGVFAAVNSPQ